MLLTEEEAKTKDCPKQGFTRWVDDHAEAFRFACVGSQCMAWRWGDTPRETVRLYHDNPVIDGVSFLEARRYPNGWQYDHTDTDQDGRKFDLLHRTAAADAPRHGFCGLAGKAGA